MVVYDPESEEQQNYAGLTSTIFILFYYLQYDVKIDSERRRLWIPYQTILFLAIEAGDILYIIYYRYRERDIGLMIFFIIYTVIDAGFVICVGYLKYKRKLHVKMEITKEAFFHLMSRLEVLLIVLIPLYANYDVISTNSIAFFILYDLFSHFYDDENLTYRKWSLLSFWSLIFFATVTVIFENVEFICTRLAYSAHEAHDPLKEKLYHTRAQILRYTNNGTELLASIACYTLILLQFFTKSNKRNETESDNTGNIQQ